MTAEWRIVNEKDRDTIYALNTVMTDVNFINEVAIVRHSKILNIAYVQLTTYLAFLRYSKLFRQI